MGLQSALWTGMNGMLAYQTAIDTTANNTANINTIGFKKTDVNFADMLYSTLNPGSTEDGGFGSTNPMQIGNGTYVSSLNRNFTQGALLETGKTFNFAIEGNGFFVVRDGLQEYLTRAGDFYLGSTLNREQVDLLSGEGLAVRGYLAASGVLSNTMTDITLPALGTMMPGQKSENVTVNGNLSSLTNNIAHGNTVTAANGWLNAQGQTVNGITVGGVQTSAELYDRVTGIAATATTKLTDLQFQNVNGLSNLFRDPLPGGNLIGRTLDVEFEREGQIYTKSLTVTAATTLQDLSVWFTGALGDDTNTPRYNGGVLDTMHTKSYSEIPDGFNLLGENAGGFLSMLNLPGAGSQLNLACNIGAANFISNLRLTANTVMDNKALNIVEEFTTFFSPNKNFPVDKAINPLATYPKFVAGVDNFAMEKDKQLIHFVRVGTDSAGSTWRWYAVDAATEKENASPSSINQGTGILRFDTAGELLTSNVEGGTNLNFDFSKMTQMSAADSLTAAADGYPQGALKEYSTGTDGIIYGRYDNEVTRILAQVSLAVVANPAGMYGESGTLFIANEISGAPIYSQTGALTEFFGQVVGGWLEESNYNLGSGDAIIYQRAYQFSSRIITTADEMLKEAIAMKK